MPWWGAEEGVKRAALKEEGGKEMKRTLAEANKNGDWMKEMEQQNSAQNWRQVHMARNQDTYKD